MIFKKIHHQNLCNSINFQDNYMNKTSVQYYGLMKTIKLIFRF